MTGREPALIGDMFGEFKRDARGAATKYAGSICAGDECPNQPDPMAFCLNCPMGGAQPPRRLPVSSQPSLVAPLPPPTHPLFPRQAC
jgi:hypothetical protein